MDTITLTVICMAIVSLFGWRMFVSGRTVGEQAIAEYIIRSMVITKTLPDLDAVQTMFNEYDAIVEQDDQEDDQEEDQ